jgi:DivIVA domain-containing protein
MAGKKRFKSSFMGGFKKAEVNAYIDNLINDFNIKTRDKDVENTVLKTKLQEVEAKYADVSAKYEATENDRKNIAGALISAQAKADSILVDAQKNYETELKDYDRMLDAEKEKLVEMKKQVRSVRTLILEIMKGFEESTSKIIEDEKTGGEDERAAGIAGKEQ